jgi:hypothetical protein
MTPRSRREAGSTRSNQPPDKIRVYLADLGRRKSSETPREQPQGVGIRESPRLDLGDATSSDGI